jgi:GTPase SAR1 family protein
MSQTSDDVSSIPMIVVMGVTGAGKSYFINSLAGRTVVKIGNTLDPCMFPRYYRSKYSTNVSLGTENCQLIPVNVGNTKLLVLDTPGFDDNARTDSEILTEIARVLSAQYTLGVKLKGIIYIHRITDIRYSGSSVKTFEVFKKICGTEALSNVLLATSRWADVDQVVGADRERQLRDKFWTFMLSKGSNMIRFHGDRDSAIALVSQLVSKDSVVLELQKELVDEGKQLNQTIAGSFVSDDVEELKVRYTKELADLEKLKKGLLDDDRKLKRKIQKEWEEEQRRLRQAYEDEITLQKRVGKDVQADIAKKKSSGGLSALPFLPMAVGLLGAIVGIPSPVTDILFSWFGDIDFGGLFDGFSM